MAIFAYLALCVPFLILVNFVISLSLYGFKKIEPPLAGAWQIYRSILMDLFACFKYLSRNLGCITVIRCTLLRPCLSCYLQLPDTLCHHYASEYFRRDKPYLLEHIYRTGCQKRSKPTLVNEDSRNNIRGKESCNLKF